MFFIRPNLKNIKDYKKVGILSILISAGFLFLSVASILLLFPFLTAGNSVLSVYLTTRTIQFGNILPRTDALFMFIWIYNFVLYLSVIILYVVKVNKETFSLKSPSIVIYIVGFFIFITALIPQNTMQIAFLETIVYKYFSIFVVFILNFIILLIGYFKKKHLTLNHTVMSSNNRRHLR